MDFPEPTGPIYSSYHPNPGPRTKLMRPHYTSCREGLFSSEPVASNFLPLTCIPTMLYSPPTTPPALPLLTRWESRQSPFLRLPTEIRLQIYALLVLPSKAENLVPSYQKINASAQDYFDYDKKQAGTDKLATADLTRPTLHIRTIDGTKYSQLHGAARPHRKSNYSIRADRFRNRCMTTTYHCVNNPRIEEHLGLLGTNKQIHAEVAELLYSSYTFDFDTHVEAIIPFFRDLTPFARSCIKNVRLVKRALPYDKEFDRAEWSSALRYLTNSSSNVNIRRLELGVVAGRPGSNGWDRIPTYSARDFELLKDVGGMEWMQYLMEFKDLQEMEVNAVIEHCPPATNSMAMAGYIRFSASVETGFSTFIRNHLLGVKDA